VSQKYQSDYEFRVSNKELELIRLGYKFTKGELHPGLYKKDTDADRFDTHKVFTISWIEPAKIPGRHVR